MAKIKKSVITQTIERDGFEVDGKLYGFVGKVEKFIIPGMGKLEIAEILEKPEVLADLVKGKSALIEYLGEVEAEPETSAS